MEFVIRFFCQSEQESKHLDNAEKELNAGSGSSMINCRELLMSSPWRITNLRHSNHTMKCINKIGTGPSETKPAQAGRGVD